MKLLMSESRSSPFRRVISLVPAVILLLIPSAVSLEVIGAGLARTGSNSFKAALGILLEGPTHSLADVLSNTTQREGWLEVLRNPNDNNTELLLELIDGYDAVNGPPAGLFYKQLIQEFPEAKVVVTQHPKGPQGWYKSTIGTIFRLNFEIFNSTWIGQIPRVHKTHEFLREMYIDSPYVLTRDEWQQQEVALQRYNDWTAEVVQNVPAERLLIFTPSDGWEPLCAFLGKPVPDEPYPHHFSKGTNVKRIIMMFKIVRIAVPVIALVVTSWICRKLMGEKTKETKSEKGD
jgi:hypothetical protein